MSTPGQGICPICAGAAAVHDTVDFNKSCIEGTGTFLPRSGIPIQYLLCQQCGFCFAPELYRWKPEEFASKIYNSDYITVDPDWLEVRPRGNAQHLAELFGTASEELRHLDYGGGSGLLSDLLLDAGWQSTSYDPFVDHQLHLHDFGKFDLISSFEVFEHVPDSTRLIADLVSLLDDEGIIYFSTLLNDDRVVAGQPLTWWYAAPRNGHISLYSRKSLEILGAREGLLFGSFTQNLHAYWRRVPAWAQHLFPKP